MQLRHPHVCSSGTTDTFHLGKSRHPRSPRGNHGTSAEPPSGKRNLTTPYQTHALQKGSSLLYFNHSRFL